MTNQMIALSVFGYIGVVGVVAWIIQRAPGVDPDTQQIPRERTAPVTDAPAAPLEAISPGGCSPTILAGPAVALKKSLLIERCSDPMLWYAKLVGKKVPYIREYPAEGCYISREPAGFTNIVHMKDARIVIGAAE